MWACLNEVYPRFYAIKAGSSGTKHIIRITWGSSAFVGEREPQPISKDILQYRSVEATDGLTTG